MSTNSPSKQKPVIHPKLRGKLENWQRNQAILSNVEDQKQTGSGSGGEGDAGPSKAGSLSKSSFFHEDYDTVARRSSFGESSKSKLLPTPQPEIIHSGHFMVSELADESGDESDGESRGSLQIAIDNQGENKFDSDARKKHQSGGSNRSSSIGEVSHRKSVNIDGSLSKLFKHMSLAYSGKITSPKWKQFSGLKLMLKDKIRLNNVIWRAWHKEYVRTQRPSIRMFATPLEEDHKKPQSVLLEGKYWKRRMAAIIEEYKKWRKFSRPVRDAPLSEEDINVVDGANQRAWNGLDREMAPLLARVGKGGGGPQARRSAIAGTVAPQDSSSIEDVLQMMDFSDTLFHSLNQPFAFPDPREIAQAANNADIIQPSLIQLQPTLDDFMPDFNDFFTTDNLFSSTPSASNAHPQQQSMNQHQEQHHQLVQLQQPQHTFLSDDQMFVTQLAVSGGSGNVNAGLTEVRQLQPVPPTSVFANDWLTDISMNEPPPQLTPLYQQPRRMTTKPEPTTIAYASIADDNCNTLTVITAADQMEGPLVTSSSKIAARENPASFLVQPGQHSVQDPVASTRAVLDVVGGNAYSAATRYDSVATSGTAGAATPTIDSKEESLRQLREFQDTFSALSPASLSYVNPGSSQLLVNLLKSESVSGIGDKTGNDGSSLARGVGIGLGSGVGSGLGSGVGSSVGSSVGSGGDNSSVGLDDGSGVGNSVGSSVGIDVGSGAQSPLTGLSNAPLPPSVAPSVGRKSRHKSADSHLANRNSQPSSSKSNLFGTTPIFPIPIAPNRTVITSTKSTNPNLKISIADASSYQQQQQQQLQQQHLDQYYPPSDGNRSSGIPKHNRLILPSPVTLPSSSTSSTRGITPVPVSIRPCPPGLSIGGSLSPAILPRTHQPPQSFIFSPAVVPTTSQPPPQRDVVDVVTPPKPNHRKGGVPRSTTSTPSPVGSSVPDLVALKPSPTSSSSNSSTTTPKKVDVAVVAANPLKRDEDEDDEGSPWAAPSFKKTKIDLSGLEEEDGRNQRRQKVHVSSEQKRRGNINSGFEMLQAMIPSANSNLKVSKAQTLQKTTEYVLKLKQERDLRKLELANLRAEADGFGRAITEYQNALPATGVSFSFANVKQGKVEQAKLLWNMYRDYVRSRTMENWKFWVLSKLLTPLYETYVSAVTVLKLERTEELVEALQNWMEKHCSLTALRPMIMNALRRLSTSTSIINRPDRLPQQAVEDVNGD